MPEGQSPLDRANELVRLTRRKKHLDMLLKRVTGRVNDLQAEILDLIEEGHLPEKFSADGATIFTREDIWASPAEGNHEKLTEVLSQLGLVEYLPSKVNSQSISAFVREHKDDEGEFDEDKINPELRAALKISRTTKAVVNGA